MRCSHVLYRMLCFDSYLYSDKSLNSLLIFPDRCLYWVFFVLAVRLLYVDMIPEKRLGNVSGFNCFMIAKFVSIDKKLTILGFFGCEVPFPEAGAIAAVIAAILHVRPFSLFISYIESHPSRF